jgi:perosamine synthetase
MCNMKKFLSLDIGPNYQPDDAKIATLSILNLSQTDDTFAKKWFKKRFETPDVWFYDTCRAGIYSILKSLELDSGDEVLVQGFSCIVVPNAVLQAGLRPIICDVSTENFNFDLDQIESKITANTRVWILQYNFGIVPDMQRVQQICETYGLILIEDCAHSLGAEFEIKGKKYPVGNFGHAAAFSFGRDKIISTTTGGAVIFNHETPLKVRCDIKKASQNLAKSYETLETMSQTQSFQNLLYALLTPTLIKPLYNFGIGKLVAYSVARLKLTGLIYNQAEKEQDIKHFPLPKKYPSKLFSLLNNQLQKLNSFNRHRKCIVKIYATELGLNYTTNNVYMRFPVYLKVLTQSDSIAHNQKVWDSIFRHTRQKGYFLGKWYFRAFLGASVDDQRVYKYNLKELKNLAILIQNQVLNLPTNIDTTEKDAYKIVELIKKSIEV